MIDKNKLIPIADIQNEEVKQLAEEAIKYLRSHTWCESITNGFLAWAIANIIGVFLFHIKPSNSGVDDILWVIIGDLPPAYLVTDNTETWQDALDEYINEMNNWVIAVRNSKSLDNIIPVNASPNLENAELLDKRLHFIKNNFINVSPDLIEGDI